MATVQYENVALATVQQAKEVLKATLKHLCEQEKNLALVCDRHVHIWWCFRWCQCRTEERRLEELRRLIRQSTEALHGLEVGDYQPAAAVFKQSLGYLKEPDGEANWLEQRKLSGPRRLRRVPSFKKRMMALDRALGYLARV